MKSSKPLLISLLGFVVLLVALFVSIKRHQNRLAENVQTSWALVQVLEQRRNDLVPQVLAIVSPVLKREKNILQDVKAAQGEVPQARLTQAILQMMTAADHYPALKNNPKFLDLKSRLEGAERRIAIARLQWIHNTQKLNATLSNTRF